MPVSAIIINRMNSASEIEIRTVNALTSFSWYSSPLVKSRSAEPKLAMIAIITRTTNIFISISFTMWVKRMIL